MAIKDKLRDRELLILILCVLVAFALRFYSFDQKSLWIDEIHTYNDSRDSIQNQLKYYKENPTYLHPPLFFVLTHLFYPFTKPERDLRITPLILGILSIPMIYLLSRIFSRNIALPCAISLTFMVYHIYFSQDGRMYSLMMLIGMVGIYFFMKYLQTLKKKYLPLVAICFAILFHTSYSSILFVILIQMLWFYRVNEAQEKPRLSSFFILNGITLLLCVPWILFILFNRKGEPFMDPLTIQNFAPLWNLLRAILNDWAPYLPLMITSGLLLIVFPIFEKNKKNAFVLLAIWVLPVVGLYSYCRLFNITQFITSRYFISFLPVFLITLYLSLDAIEFKSDRLKRLVHPRFLFLILFIASNLIILPLYYRAEKQDFRGLVNYLNHHVRDGDRIIVGTFTYIPGILHYFGVEPKGRHYSIPYSWIDPGKEFEFKVSLVSENRNLNIYHSNIPYGRYVADGSRLWVVAGKGPTTEAIRKNLPCVLKGYFDGSFAMFRTFPSDASMYLFLWDPQSPGEKGIDMPID
jgi:mannosyltransferase